MCDRADPEAIPDRKQYVDILHQTSQAKFPVRTIMVKQIYARPSS